VLEQLAHRLEARVGLERLADQIRLFREGRATRRRVADFKFKGKVERFEWNP